MLHPSTSPAPKKSQIIRDCPGFGLFKFPRISTHLKAIIEIFRFYDDYDNEYEIFSVVSGARAWTSVILAGKRDSRRHSMTSFRENLVVPGNKLSKLTVLLFYNRERA